MSEPLGERDRRTGRRLLMRKILQVRGGSPRPSTSVQSESGESPNRNNSSVGDSISTSQRASANKTSERGGHRQKASLGQAEPRQMEGGAQSGSAAPRANQLGRNLTRPSCQHSKIRAPDVHGKYYADARRQPEGCERRMARGRSLRFTTYDSHNDNLQLTKRQRARWDSLCKL